jgi:hypothetical protein
MLRIRARESSQEQPSMAKSSVLHFFNNNVS